MAIDGLLPVINPIFYGFFVHIINLSAFYKIQAKDNEDVHLRSKSHLFCLSYKSNLNKG